MFSLYYVYITFILSQNEDGTMVEYRVWNPFRSKLAAAILGGVDNVWIKPGARVLYLGAASGTTVSHVSDIVGPEGVVYAVEFSHRSGRDLVNMAKKRTNIIPIIEDARHPAKYRMLVVMVDVIFSDVAQPDQARILALNGSYFLKAGGNNANQETGAKVQVYGTKKDTGGKVEITPSDGNEIENTCEDMYVHVSADTFEKVDAAVALIELLLTPVSVNI
ncbi:hypothetical protein ACS0TY_023531 [Phlomoides rotata]